MARIHKKLAQARARLDRYESMNLKWITALAGLVISLASFAKDYPIFDGRHYNGLYYPRIQVIEWDTPEYLVFNIYSKDKPVDVSGEVIERGANKIFQFQYDLTHRGEKVCRSVIAPPSWKVGQKLNFFIDKADPEMDQIYVSANSLKFAPYKTPEFTNCKTVAQKEGKKEEKRNIASTPDVAAGQAPTPAANPATSNELVDLPAQPPSNMPVWYDDQPNTGNKYDLFQ